MPEIKFPSDFLKLGTNVEHGDEIRFLDAGELDPETERYIFSVSVIKAGKDIETKKFNLNKTNFKAVAALYGTNSDAWIGKLMRVTSMQVRNPQTGLIGPGITLTAPNPAAPTA